MLLCHNVYALMSIVYAHMSQSYMLSIVYAFNLKCLMVTNMFNIQDKLCGLLVEPNSIVVARGLVVETKGTITYGIEMDPYTVYVEVKVVINPSAEISIPVNDEIYLVEYAVGTLVPWPKELVLQGTLADGDQLIYFSHLVIYF